MVMAGMAVAAAAAEVSLTAGNSDTTLLQTRRHKHEYAASCKVTT